MQVPHDSLALVADGAKLLLFGNAGEADLHQQSEDRLAAGAAALVDARAQANAFERVILVAPPRTLGEFRRHRGKTLESKTAGEFAEDLIGYSLHRIEAVLQAA